MIRDPSPLDQHSIKNPFSFRGLGVLTASSVAFSWESVSRRVNLLARVSDLPGRCRPGSQLETQMSETATRLMEIAPEKMLALHWEKEKRSALESELAKAG